MRLRRRGDEQWSQGNNSTLGTDAIDRRDSCRKSMDALVAEDSGLVSLGQNPERSIFHGRIVKAHAHRRDMASSASRGMRGIDPLFDRPSPPAGLLARLQRQGSVLMPHHEPICRRRFVKQSCWIRECLRSQNFTGESHDLWWSSQGPDRSLPESVSHACAAALRSQFIDLSEDVRGPGPFVPAAKVRVRSKARRPLPLLYGPWTLPYRAARSRNHHHLLRRNLQH
jgi:hypothetical protein